MWLGRPLCHVYLQDEEGYLAVLRGRNVLSEGMRPFPLRQGLHVATPPAAP